MLSPSLFRFVPAAHFPFSPFSATRATFAYQNTNRLGLQIRIAIEQMQGRSCSPLTRVQYHWSELAESSWSSFQLLPSVKSKKDRILEEGAPNRSRPHAIVAKCDNRAHQCRKRRMSPVCQAITNSVHPFIARPPRQTRPPFPARSASCHCQWSSQLQPLPPSGCMAPP